MRGTDRVVVSAESVRDFYIRQVHADPAQGRRHLQRGRLRASADHDASGELRCVACGVPADALVGGHHRAADRAEGHIATSSTRWRRTPALASAASDRDRRRRSARRRSCAGRSTRACRPRAFSRARRDLGDLLAAMDVFVMPSLWEGLPLSMVLAMGAGLPVVATRVAGIPEVVDDGGTGLLVPPGDAPALGAALARAGRPIDASCESGSGAMRAPRASCRASASTATSAIVASSVALRSAARRRRSAGVKLGDRLPHAVLARRRRDAARGRRIVRALRRLARAVLRRDRAVRAGAVRSARRRHADPRDQRHAGAAPALRRTGAVLSAAAAACCRASCRFVRDASISCTAGCRRRRRSSRSRSRACSCVASFLLVVGDLRALLPTMPYRGLKRLLWRAYTAFEERNMQWMADRALTFANGAALAREALARGPAGDRNADDDHQPADIVRRARTPARRPRSGC